MGDSGHWVKWHSDYDDSRSNLSRRLVVIQRRLDEALSSMPFGPIQLTSMCAGQGRDVIGVLEKNERVDDTRALLVESDSQLCRDAETAARKAGITNIEVRSVDGSTTSAYVDGVPANVLLVCGIFGNISDEDVHLTISLLPTFLSSNAIVIWTRHRRLPDLTVTIRRWLGEFGFAEIAFDTEDDASFTVGTHRFVGVSQPFEPNQKLFTFVDDCG